MWNTEAGTNMERKGQGVTMGPNSIKVIYRYMYHMIAYYAMEYTHVNSAGDVGICSLQLSSQGHILCTRTMDCVCCVSVEIWIYNHELCNNAHARHR